MMSSILEQIQRYDADHSWLRQFVIPEARRFLLSADSPFVIRRRALLESHPILHYLSLA